MKVKERNESLHQYYLDTIDALKEKRKEKKVTQISLAKKIGVTTTYISCVERGECVASAEILLGYIQYLGLNGLSFSEKERNKEEAILPELVMLLAEMPLSVQQSLCTFLKKMM